MSGFASSSGAFHRPFLPPVSPVGYEGLKRADRLLKELQTQGLLIGSLSHAVWSASHIERLREHRDADILILSMDRDKHPWMREEGIDWWVTDTPHLQPTNGNPLFELSAMIRLQCFLPPGLYLPSPSLLREWRKHELDLFGESKLWTLESHRPAPLLEKFPVLKQEQFEIRWLDEKSTRAEYHKSGYKIPDHFSHFFWRSASGKRYYAGSAAEMQAMAELVEDQELIALLNLNRRRLVDGILETLIHPSIRRTPWHDSGGHPSLIEAARTTHFPLLLAWSLDKWNSCVNEMTPDDRALSEDAILSEITHLVVENNPLITLFDFQEFPSLESMITHYRNEGNLVPIFAKLCEINNKELSVDFLRKT